MDVFSHVLLILGAEERADRAGHEVAKAVHQLPKGDEIIYEA